MRFWFGNDSTGTAAALRTPNALAWLFACWRARRIARRLLFSQRQWFFRELCPRIQDNMFIPYPEGWFLITNADVSRALRVVSDPKFADQTNAARQASKQS